jgi:hypothetical protein
VDNQLYKLSKAVIFTDHNRKNQTLLQGQFFHWNGHRFVTAERDLVPIEIPRSKVNAAGARMIPCDGQGNVINQNIVAEVAA